MTNDLRGTFPGATPHDRAVLVAGFLAEQGVASLRIASTPESGWTTLNARATDLPAALGERESWVLEAPGLRVQGGRDEARWTCSDPAVAAALCAIVPPSRPGC